MPVDWGYADADEHWEMTIKLAAPIAEAVNALPPDEQERVRATVAERIEPLLADDGKGANGLTHVVVAE